MTALDHGVNSDDLSFLGMVWSCMNEAIWFAAGFLLFRLASRCNLIPAKLGPSRLFGVKKAPGAGKALNEASRRIVEAEPQEALALWASQRGQLQPLALEALAEAMAKLEPGRLGELIPQLVQQPSKHIAVQHTVLAVLKVSPALAEDWILQLEAEKELAPCVTPKLRKALVGAYAQCGDVGKVRALQGGNAAIKGYMEGGFPDLAFAQLQEMSSSGQPLDAAAAQALLAEEEPARKALELLQGMDLPVETVAVAMSACQRFELLPVAKALREGQHGQLPFTALEPFLKLLAKHDECAALRLLEEMMERKMFLSEGLCGLLLARCGEARHLRLAEAVQAYLRQRKMTSLATYKTLMKVYATCEMLPRACDLYDDITEDGIVPDAVMYGCLMKFAVKCGRDDLSERLFHVASEKPQGNGTQNYLWLIRSAGQKRDVGRAVGLLRQLQRQASHVDAAVYNCVLDVCMGNGAQDMAEEIFQEMLNKKSVTLVTYNTLMKGYAAQGDFQRAKKLIQEMQANGFTPNSSSFNCVISAAVGAGSFDQAWSVYEEMLSCHVAADSFTVCILMKIVRKARSRQEAQRALAVLDRSKVDICKDEVLLNTVLDACIHLKDTRRLQSVLRQFERTTMKPSVQNYGLIIKAYACLKQTKRCWAVWEEMTEPGRRGLTPSDVALSCMLDAVVSSGQVEEAVALFEQWKSLVPPNTIIFSNLIKGFAVQGDAERAMDMYHQLKAYGLSMNLVAYSTLIDAQARAGNVEKAHGLLELMETDGVRPNTVTYSSLVKGHCLKGDLDGALQTFQSMVAKGLHADTVMYNTILDGAVRASRFTLCDQLLQDMAKSGTELSNFTLSIIVKMWGKRKQLDKAFAEVRKHSKTGLMQLDSKLCTCLLSACFHNGAASRALEALEEVKQLPNCDGPDAGTYEQLVEQLIKVRHSQEACAVAEEASKMAAQGSIKPLNVSVLRQLQRHLTQSGHGHLWKGLRDFLQDAQLPMP